jgi:hypothetical protein
MAIISGRIVTLRPSCAPSKQRLNLEISMGRPGEAPALAGTDFIIARDGRIAAIYLFFDKLP